MNRKQSEEEELKAICVFLGTRIVIVSEYMKLRIRPLPDSEAYSLEISSEIVGVPWAFGIDAPRMKTQGTIDALISEIKTRIYVVSKTALAHYLNQNLHVHSLKEG